MKLIVNIVWAFGRRHDVRTCEFSGSYAGEAGAGGAAALDLAGAADSVVEQVLVPEVGRMNGRRVRIGEIVETVDDGLEGIEMERLGRAIGHDKLTAFTVGTDELDVCGLKQNETNQTKQLQHDQIIISVKFINHDK